VDEFANKLAKNEQDYPMLNFETGEDL